MQRMLVLTLVAAILACTHTRDAIRHDPRENAWANAPAVTLKLTLEHAAVPGDGHPDAIVYVPTGFDRDQPLSVIVYFHGWKNCASTVLGDKDEACVPGHGLRVPHHLAAQLEASGKNAILVVPELAFDEESSNPGKLVEDGHFDAMMAEIMEKSSDAIGKHKAKDIAELVVVSHSGGYLAAAAVVAKSKVGVAELILLDSLNGAYDDFDGWVKHEKNQKLFVESPPRRRFVSLYTQDGGTLEASRAMAGRALAWFNGSDVVLDERGAGKTRSLRRGLVFKLVGCGHEDVPRDYFQALLESSVIPDKGGGRAVASAR